MITRQSMAALIKLHDGMSYNVLKFFFFLAERLKDNIIVGYRIYIAAWNLRQLMFPGVIPGGEGHYRYYRWSHNDQTDYVYLDQFFSIVQSIRCQLNPENFDTKELYQFDPDNWHLIILSDLIINVLANGEQGFSQNYITQEPQANCIVAEISGQFYVAVRPEDPPLVSVGEEVEESQDVCVIVVSKTNNYIGSPLHCRITKVLVKNDTAVEAGQPLFEIISIEE